MGNKLLSDRGVVIVAWHLSILCQTLLLERMMIYAHQREIYWYFAAKGRIVRQ